MKHKNGKFVSRLDNANLRRRNTSSREHGAATLEVSILVVLLMLLTVLAVTGYSRQVSDLFNLSSGNCEDRCGSQQITAGGHGTGDESRSNDDTRPSNIGPSNGGV